MEHLPLISVITPTFNRANYLGVAIESVVNQSYKNIEHIIIDDGSTDSTRDLVSNYKNSTNVRYFYQANSGQSTARNRGLEEAKGEFICFLDSDDYFLPDKINKSLEAFQKHPNADLVYGDYVFVDDKGDELKVKNMPRHSGSITKQLIYDNCISMNTTMVKKSSLLTVGGFDETIEVADDYDLWLRLSVTGIFLYLPIPLSAYRLMSDQLSSDKIRRFNSNERILSNFFENNPELFHLSEQSDSFNKLFTRATRHFSSVQDNELAYHFLKKAFRANPYAIRTWRTYLRYLLNKLKD